MVYKPTVPRGPISAMYSTPGPAYALPGLIGQKTHDPRSVHNRGPSYSFGLKSGKFKDECSPGPAYYPNSRITRSGRDGTPAYSLYSRHNDKNNSKTPGPGEYKVVKKRQLLNEIIWVYFMRLISIYSQSKRTLWKVCLLVRPRTRSACDSAVDRVITRRRPMSTLFRVCWERLCKVRNLKRRAIRSLVVRKSAVSMKIYKRFYYKIYTLN